MCAFLGTLMMIHLTYISPLKFHMNILAEDLSTDYEKEWKPFSLKKRSNQFIEDDLERTL